MKKFGALLTETFFELYTVYIKIRTAVFPYLLNNYFFILGAVV